MTREELDFIGSMNMCDEISNEAYKKIVCHCRKQEPCEDAISRQAVINAIANTCFWLSSDNWEELIKCINSIPSVNPQLKTGHWINTNSEDFEFHRVYKCSECGITEIEYPEGISRFRYCLNCGAKMVEPQERSE